MGRSELARWGRRGRRGELARGGRGEFVRPGERELCGPMCGTMCGPHGCRRSSDIVLIEHFLLKLVCTIECSVGV